jgi:CheY-like chemotaxis protein
VKLVLAEFAAARFSGEDRRIVLSGLVENRLSPSMSRSRLLVADDDSLFRAYLATVLRKEFIVALAGDGNEAVLKATEHPPDCALIDVQMPGMDGLQTLRAFRAHPVLRKVPVIILSADNSRSTVMSAISGGAADYLVKGNFEDAALVSRVKRAVQLAKNPPQRVGHTPMPHVPVPQRAAVAVTASAAPAPAAVPSFDEEAVKSILDNWE